MKKRSAARVVRTASVLAGTYDRRGLRVRFSAVNAALTISCSGFDLPFGDNNISGGRLVCVSERVSSLEHCEGLASSEVYCRPSSRRQPSTYSKFKEDRQDESAKQTAARCSSDGSADNCNDRCRMIRVYALHKPKHKPGSMYTA